LIQGTKNFHKVIFTIYNLGISRDIGAALTRYCIRQRSIESGLRKISQPLIEEFAGELERKCAEWKHSVIKLIFLKLMRKI